MKTKLLNIKNGFTLVEMAIVLMIVGLLLGGLLPTISSQIEQQRTNETRKALEEIKDALYGFAVANGRLPCPAFSSGQESFCTTDTYPCTGSASSVVQSHGRCTNPFNGFVPAATLGITPTDSQGFALDGWSNRIRYAVTTDHSNAFTTINGMQTTGMATLSSELRVCASSFGNTPITPPQTSCGTAQALTTTAQNAVPAIIFSQGQNWATGGISSDEASNLNGDAVFISHTPTSSSSPGGEFDDIVTWLSPNILYNRMVAAGKLP